MHASQHQYVYDGSRPPGRMAVLRGICPVALAATMGGRQEES